MFEQWQYTVPASTAEANLVRRELAISKGILKRLEVLMPFGCEFYVKSRVSIGAKPLLPRASKGYVTGNGFPIGTGDIIEPVIDDLPLLMWELWNEDATYSHTITLSAMWFSIEEQEAIRNELRQANEYLKDIADALGGKPIQLSELT